MANLGFYDENRGRDYPFLAETTGLTMDHPSYLNNLQTLPQETIVDFGCTLGLDAKFIPGNTVYLYKVTVTGLEGDHTAVFEFRSNAAGLYGYSLIFERHETDMEFSTEYVMATRNSLITSQKAVDDAESACDAPDFWHGYLVTGDLKPLFELVDTGTLGAIADLVVVEPATIKNFGQSFVRSFNLANADRSRATTAEGCRDYCWDFDTGEIYVNAQCLTGHLLLEAGYNSNLRQEPDNVLVIGANIGAGAGEPCEEVPLFEGEAGPDGEELLTGGPKCGQLLRTINGINAVNFVINAEAGATVTVDAENGIIVADVNMSQLTGCIEEVDSDDDECDPTEYSANPCDCGPA